MRSVARVSNHLSDPPSFVLRPFLAPSLPLKLVLAITQTTTSGKEGRSRVPRGVLRAFLSSPFPAESPKKSPILVMRPRAQWRAEQSVRRGCENRIRSFVSPTQSLDCNVATPLRQRLLGLYVIGPPLCCPCPTPSRAPVFCEWCARTHTLTLTKSKRGSIHPRSTHFLTLPEQVYFYCIGGGYFVV